MHPLVTIPVSKSVTYVVTNMIYLSFTKTDTIFTQKITLSLVNIYYFEYIISTKYYTTKHHKG